MNHKFCCQKMKSSGVIGWKKRDTRVGPLRSGFCMSVQAGEEMTFINIEFCPFCGDRLEEKVNRNRFEPVDTRT